MKRNDRCALEMLMNGRWVPLAIRYQRFSKKELRLLAKGETIIHKERTIRRCDWGDRQALATIFLKE